MATKLKTITDTPEPAKGGRPPGPKGKIGRAAREWIAENSKCLETLSSVARGRAVRTRGPTGKSIWYYPTWEDRRWAIGLLLPRIAPAITASEISGKDGEALQIKATRIESRDVARRLLHAVMNGGSYDITPTDVTPVSEGGAPAPGRATLLEPTPTPEKISKKFPYPTNCRRRV